MPSDSRRGMQEWVLDQFSAPLAAIPELVVVEQGGQWAHQGTLFAIVRKTHAVSAALVYHFEPGDITLTVWPGTPGQTEFARWPDGCLAHESFVPGTALPLNRALLAWLDRLIGQHPDLLRPVATRRIEIAATVRLATTVGR